MAETTTMVVIPQVLWENISKTLSNVEALLQKKTEEEVSN